MGLFDSFVRSVESGNLEKALVKAVDGLETKLDKVVDKVDQAAAKLDTPGQAPKKESEQQS